MATQLRAANRQLMREINTSLVLSLIRQHGPIARTQIAELASLSAATVTGITSELIADGLVFETSTGTSTGGRRPILLTFNSHAGIALGVKITESHIVSVDCDLDGSALHRTDIPLPDPATPARITQVIADIVNDAKSRHAQPLFGIGVGVAGVVDQPTGVCLFSPFLRWRNVPLAALIEEATGSPVVIANAVNALTQAFSKEAPEESRESFVVVTLGHGVGLGMKWNGQLFRGTRGQAGEFGHITIDPEGSACECGKRGCLESVISIPAMIRQIEAMTGNRVDPVSFQERVLGGEPPFARIVEQSARILGGSLATLVNILNPEAIVLSGEGAWMASHTLATIDETMNTQVFPGLRGQTRLRVRERDDGFWAQGAAHLLIEDVLTPRLATHTAIPAEVS